MKRHQFVKVLATGSVGAAVLGEIDARANTLAASNAEPKKVLMKVGCQSGGTSVENLEFKARHGVYNIDGGAPKIVEGKGWDLDDSMRKR